MAALSVEDLLARAEEHEAETQRSVTVHKELELEFDLGNLLALDKNPVARAVSSASQREALLRALARDNTQLLVGQVWALPSERAEGGAGPVVARLPEPSTRLPREKPLPKPRPPTRWEQFAKLKGIRPNRKKRGTLVWDEAAKDWRRRWGYRRAGSDPSGNWVLEVPDSADPLEDQFAKRRQEKREKVARNEFNRLRNLARAQRGGAGAALHPTGHQDRAELGRVTGLARLATASRGRFQPRLPKESPAPPSVTGRGKKRRFEPVLGDLEGEKKRHLELARSLSSKKSPLDLTRAVNRQLREEEAEAAEAKGKKRGQRGKRARRQQQRPGGPKGKKSGGAARRGNPGSVRGKRKKK
ncbi:ribosome biogenesis regulatory protein homolog [Hemicordylus capensis]|uniref:ribosome biogenesis regulatory protein homolog n=1 Tax=Hemicordylus capensis TaxID=884348 RepID=UPI002304C5F7|nr:ribosome biogenesis regulatory protein homolog [Hemicordylus capensis]